jgi:hypothetical protein
MSDVQPVTESRSTVTEPPCDTNRTDPLDVLGTAVLLRRQRFTITSRVTGSSARDTPPPPEGVRHACVVRRRTVSRVHGAVHHWQRTVGRPTEGCN